MHRHAHRPFHGKLFNDDVTVNSLHRTGSTESVR
jgi:hypothetical protein